MSKEERYALRRENLIAIQGKFFDVMEANPEIFKIPCLQMQRKKILKERKHQEFDESDKIEFEQNMLAEHHLISGKVVSCLR